MQLRGITLKDFREAVEAVNGEYDNNLRVHPDAHMIGAHTTVGRLTVVSSGGSGSRRSWQGRKCQAACWHAFRDIISELLKKHPEATVVTSMARYTADNFEYTYPRTAYVNIGSQFQPVTMPELCDCHRTFFDW